MNLVELINQNVSKKMGLAIACMITLAQMSAPTWQIMAVGIAAIFAQGILDFKGRGKGQNGNGDAKNGV